jgi:hypothetical protein
MVLAALRRRFGNSRIAGCDRRSSANFCWHWQAPSYRHFRHFCFQRWSFRTQWGLLNALHNKRYSIRWYSCIGFGSHDRNIKQTWCKDWVMDARNNNLMQPDLTDSLFGFGANRFEKVFESQKELFNTFEQINQEWFARAQQENELAIEFAGKLTSARSVPDIMNAYQQWLCRRMLMFADDGRKVFDDCQRVIDAATRLLSNGNRARRA